MNVISWNVRGLNDPLKQKAIVNRIKRLKCRLVCLVETRVKENKSQSIVDRLFNGWGMLHNYSAAYNGRIWILWDNSIRVNLIASNDQCITCNVSYDSKQFILSAVYGSNEGTNRRNLWSHLSTVNGSINQEPWLIVGDFNIIVHPSETSSYNGVQGLTSKAKEFSECIQQNAIFDHAYTGPLFTWSNRQEEGFVAKKLDRALINAQWLLSFPSSKVEFLPPAASDHCLIIVQLSHQSFSPPRPFKFFNYWARHSDFLQTVKDSWELPVVGTPMIVLQKKLKRLKDSLKAFNQMYFADISLKVKEKRLSYEEVQLFNLSNPSIAQIEQERVLAQELHSLMLNEESFYRQKSRLQWIQEGDMNTKFFHSMVAAKQKANSITALTDEQGNKLSTYAQISQEAVSFFKKLLGTIDSNVTSCPMEILSELLPKTLSDEAQLELARQITLEEVKATMFAIE